MGNMLRVSEGAAIALHAVIALGRETSRSMTTREIAAIDEVSEAHLSKVMRRLVQAGIAASSIGPGGGFKLKRPNTEIYLLEVLEIVDGHAGDTCCLLTPAKCDGTTCVFGCLADQVNQYVRQFLSTTTVADFIDSHEALLNKLQASNL